MFELKQGYNTIAGKSGIVKHYNDFNTFSENYKKVEAFREDMIKIFNQKRELGLITSKNIKQEKVDKEIDFIVILANYKSASTQLRKADIEQLKGCNFIYANGIGYGLFSKNIISQNVFLNKFNVK